MDIPVYIDNSETLQIRGVHASRRIHKGELIESCPIIPLREEDTAHIDETVLTKYYFGWKDETNCIVLGYGSLYNHSDNPNAEYRRNFADHVLEFYALRDIREEEEITIKYNQGDRELLPKDDEHLDFNSDINVD